MSEVVPPHNPDWIEGGVVNTLRGLRNGAVTGFRIRLPYIVQNIAYFVIYRDWSMLSKIKLVIKNGLHHGRNLGFFILIYKSICWICRQRGIKGGIESWIAGFIGGFIAFGDSTGLSGGVNNQIVLYLFSRGVEASLRLFSQRGILPKKLDVAGDLGFRCLAGFSLALALYMTEYHPDKLKPGFMATMNHLYYDSNSGPMLPADMQKFSGVVGIVVFSLIAQMFSDNFTMERLLAQFNPVLGICSAKRPFARWALRLRGWRRFQRG